jgi:hypothetical protein
MDKLFGDTLGFVGAPTVKTPKGVFVEGRFFTAVKVVIDGRGDLLIKFLAIHNILSRSSFHAGALHSTLQSYTA